MLIGLRKRLQGHPTRVGTTIRVIDFVNENLETEVWELISVLSSLFSFPRKLTFVENLEQECSFDDEFHLSTQGCYQLST
jgi:hypothetical protein